jgi:hypothetical protein
MREDDAAPRGKAPIDDRTERVIEEYAAELRQMLNKLRRLFN